MTTLRLLPELEEALRQVAGIRAASVVTGPDSVPTEIHIVANRSKGAKQVVRDVQSLALAVHGIDIDHRIVSVVQFDDGDNVPAVIRLPDPAERAASSESFSSASPSSDAVARPLIASISIRTAAPRRTPRSWCQPVRTPTRAGRSVRRR